MANFSAGNSNSFITTLANFKCAKYPFSSGNKNINAFPEEFKPLQVLPTLWIYSFVSSGGSYYIIQWTSGISSPLAATSVHTKTPFFALQNS